MIRLPAFQAGKLFGTLSIWPATILPPVCLPRPGASRGPAPDTEYQEGFAMKCTLAYLFGIVWLLAGCMAQQEVTVLDGRVAALETQSARAAGQNARLDANDKQVRDIRRQVAGTAAELERLREELELVRGNLEVTEHQVAKKLSASDDVEARRKMELERLEAQLVAANQKIDRILQYLN